MRGLYLEPCTLQRQGMRKITGNWQILNSKLKEENPEAEGELCETELRGCLCCLFLYMWLSFSAGGNNN